MRIAGIVLDIYDDPKGVVLRQKVAATGIGIPPKLASSQLLDVEDLDRIPDRLFALVAENHGEILRKYAMHDESHLTTSIIYFLECGGLLPQKTQEKVAANLINACAWYDLDPPEPLVKRAVLGRVMGAATVGFGAMDMADKARSGSASARKNMDALREAQASGAKVGGREIRLSPDQDAALQRGEGPDAGHIFGPLSDFSEPGKTRRNIDKALTKKDQPDPRYGMPGSKRADLNGTEVMPTSGNIQGHNPKPSPNNRIAIPAKTSAAKLAYSLIEEGWLSSEDLTMEDSPTSIRKVATATRFALPQQSRYALDTPDQVKIAEAYFNEHVNGFDLDDRRAFAQSLVRRADDFGLKVSGSALDYAGDDYGPFIEAELIARIRSFEGTEKEASYTVLLEELHRTPAIVMVEMLKSADADTGADSSYGRPSVGFLDPYRAVYGSRKLASAMSKSEKDETYSWSSGSDYVSGLQLKSLAENGYTKLDETFGKGFATSFQNDPVGIFKSMPDPQKVVLSRLAASVV